MNLQIRFCREVRPCWIISLVFTVKSFHKRSTHNWTSAKYLFFLLSSISARAVGRVRLEMKLHLLEEADDWVLALGVKLGPSTPLTFFFMARKLFRASRFAMWSREFRFFGSESLERNVKFMSMSSEIRQTKCIDTIFENIVNTVHNNIKNKHRKIYKTWWNANK